MEKRLEMQPTSDTAGATVQRGANDNGLLDDVDPRDFPCLARLLDGPIGPELAAEVSALLRRRSRAVRRNVELLGRLDGPGFRQTVRIRDLSSSGIRLRTIRRGPFDLMNANAMRLSCRVTCDDMSGSHDLDVGVALVRIVEHADTYVELGFRFVAVDSAQQAVLEAIERLYFFA